MSTKYQQSPDDPGRSEVFARGDLSRLTRRIRNFDQLQNWLVASGLEPDTELKKAHAEYMAVLEERAATPEDQPEPPRFPDCPSWVYADQVVQPQTVFSDRFTFTPPGTSTGHAPFSITEGSNEFPGGHAPLSSTVNDASAHFAGRLVDSGAGSHWYRDWRFRAALPPSPFRGDVEYSYYLFTDAWWYATTVALEGWLTLFFTTLRPAVGGGEEICETNFLIDVGWPGDRDIDLVRVWVFVSGKSTVREGDRLRVGFNAHVYAGLTQGEAVIRGGFMPHDRSGLRLDDPWPPPHPGEVRYTLTPKQVLAP
jgi:hypothetical protein